MTFSVSARCPDTGMFGMAVSSSSPAVAARCAFARAGVGAVGSQNITDPALGERCLDLMEQGASAAEAVTQIVESTEYITYRQLTAVDAFSGENTLGVYASAEDADVVCAGNLLMNTDVPAAMVASFKDCAGQYLGLRLMTFKDCAGQYLGLRLMNVMKAGLAAGGEAGTVQSAGLMLVDKVSWPVANLRVDWSDAGTPIEDLERVWEIYAPQLDDYVTRALDPSQAPSYGVPGDE